MNFKTNFTIDHALSTGLRGGRLAFVAENYGKVEEPEFLFSASTIQR